MHLTGASKPLQKSKMWELILPRHIKCEGQARRCLARNIEGTLDTHRPVREFMAGTVVRILAPKLHVHRPRIRVAVKESTHPPRHLLSIIQLLYTTMDMLSRTILRLLIRLKQYVLEIIRIHVG